VRDYPKIGGAAQDASEVEHDSLRPHGPGRRRHRLAMSRRLLALNVVLAIVSIAFIAGIERTLIVSRALPAPAGPRTATVAAPVPPAENVDRGLSGYAVIAARNLFNPARSETAVAAAPVAKPILHGVVIDGAKSRAFLEDPAAKRIAGYSTGDMIGEGRIQRITDDRVVIARPEGLLEVLLRDPSKPRAPAVNAAQTQQVPTGAQTPAPEVPSQGAQSARVRSRQSAALLPAPPTPGVPDSGGAPVGNRFYFPDTVRPEPRR
jgi:hypothetical protein